MTAGVRAAGDIIAAAPPRHWHTHLHVAAAHLPATPGTLPAAVAAAAPAWTDQPHQELARQLAHLTNRAPTSAISPAVPAAAPAEQRLRYLAASLRPGLADSPGWAALARTLDRAAAAGHDAEHVLRAAANAAPLPDRHTAQELQYRLLESLSLPPEPSPRRPYDPAAAPSGPDSTRRNEHLVRPAAQPARRGPSGPAR